MKLKKFGRRCSRVYPVLGNGNDFLKESFSTEISIRLDGSRWVISCEFICGNKQISELVDKGLAAFVLDADCPSMPGSRRSFRSKKSKSDFFMSIGEVSNEISLAAYVVADAEIKNYSPKGIHPDYKGIKFDVLPHEILAQDEDQIKMFDINKGGVDSLLKVRRSDSPGDRVMRFDERDHFWIILPMADFDNWIGTQRVSRELDQHVVAPSFVLPAVIEAIERIKKNPDYVEDEGPRWARCLNVRCRELGMDLMRSDTLEAAQKILNFPIGRVCEHVLEIGNQEA